MYDEILLTNIEFEALFQDGEKPSGEAETPVTEA